MQKIKNILSPGKPVDDETLYGASRKSSSPLSGRSSKDHGASPVSQGSPVAGKAGTERIVGEQQQQSTLSPVAGAGTATAQDYTSQPQPQTQSTAAEATDVHTAENANSEPNPFLTSDTLQPRQVAASETPSSLRPGIPTPLSTVSAASNASIKSNVVGRVPTGSVGAQGQQGDLPAVPATDGKFMNEGELGAVDGGSAHNDAYFALAGASTASQTARPHQTAAANRLDPNAAEASSKLDTTQTHPGADVTTTDSQTHDFGRDAAVAGAGVASVGAYEASQNKASINDDASLGASGTASSAAPTGTSTEPTTAGSSVPVRSDDDAYYKQMPGAYPETPQVEAEKKLETTGVESGAAVTAAQKAFQKHTPHHQKSHHKHTVDVEAETTPYIAQLDPRVDASARQAAARSAAAGATLAPTEHPQGVDAQHQKTTAQEEKVRETNTEDKHHDKSFALAGATAASQKSESHEQTQPPPGTLGEAIEESKAKQDHHGKDFALAGAATAAGVGAYAATSDRNENLPSEPEARDAPTSVSWTEKYQEDSTVPSSAIPVTEPVTEPAPVAGAGIATTSDAKQERDFPLDNTPEKRSTPANFSYPTSAKETTKEQQEAAPVPDHREVLKDVAENGGAGAAGVTAYETLNREEGHDVQTPGFDDPLASNAHVKALEGYDDQRAAPSHGKPLAEYEPDASYGHHDAALVGSSTAAATLASSKPLDTKLEKEREKTAEQKHHEYEKREKSARKSEEKHRPSSSKSDDKEHKHGLLHRILHRHKSKDDLEKEKENEPKTSLEKSTSSLERNSYEERPATGGGGSPVSSKEGGTTPDRSKYYERNRLHKEPPSGYQAKRDGEQS